MRLCRPAVDGADEPAERHLRHDELDAFERRIGATNFIVEHQEDAGGDLDAEEEEGSGAAEVIPHRPLDRPAPSCGAGTRRCR